MSEQNEEPTVEWALRVLVVDGSNTAGYGGTCHGCRFATGPVNQNESPADPRDHDNDPSEAYYFCGLPTRYPDGKNPAWGKYAPCSVGEWARWIATAAVAEHEKKSVSGKISEDDS